MLIHIETNPFQCKNLNILTILIIHVHHRFMSHTYTCIVALVTQLRPVRPHSHVCDGFIFCYLMLLAYEYSCVHSNMGVIIT